MATMAQAVVRASGQRAQRTGVKVPCLRNPEGPVGKIVALDRKVDGTRTCGCGCQGNKMCPAVDILVV